MEAAVPFLIIFVGLPSVFVLIWVQRVRHKSALARIAAHLEQASSHGTEIAGTYRGVHIAYRLTTRCSESSSESWTEVEANVPAKYPLEIHVRRQGGADRTHIERGHMVDVEVGDAEFDRAFLVEAAPADVVRRLLDGETRALLSAHQLVELDTIVESDRKLFRLAIQQWIDEKAQAVVLIERIAALAARVRDSFAEAEAATPLRDTGGPFRPQLDEQPVRDAVRAREVEVERLGAVRAARFARQFRRNAAVAIGTLIAVEIATAIATAVL